jgi:hypothetical protein
VPGGADPFASNDCNAAHCCIAIVRGEIRFMRERRRHAKYALAATRNDGLALRGRRLAMRADQLQ